MSETTPLCKCFARVAFVHTLFSPELLSLQNTECPLLCWTKIWQTSTSTLYIPLTKYSVSQCLTTGTTSYTGCEPSSVCVLKNDQLFGLLKKEAFGTCVINCFVVKFIKSISFQRSWYNEKLLNHPFRWRRRSSACCTQYGCTSSIMEGFPAFCQKNRRAITRG